MSEKVVITKEQATAIVSLTCLGWNKQKILKFRMDLPSFLGTPDLIQNSLEAIKDMDFDSLATALYDSYEVEPTPEDNVLKQYKISSQHAKDVFHKHQEYNHGMVDAIEMVLRTLKIEIEGIHK